MKRKSTLVFPEIITKPSQPDRALRFLRTFVEDNREAVTSDEPIDGADCVDYFCELWRRAETIVRGS